MFFFFSFYLWAFCLHVCPCTTCIRCLKRPEENITLPGTGARDGSECWELNPGLVSVCVCVYKGVPGVQMKASDPMDLESQAVMRLFIRVLRLNLGLLPE